MWLLGLFCYPQNKYRDINSMWSSDVLRSHRKRHWEFFLFFLSFERSPLSICVKTRERIVRYCEPVLCFQCTSSDSALSVIVSTEYNVLAGKSSVRSVVYVVNL